MLESFLPQTNQHTGFHYNTACIDYPRCWGVGTLLTRVMILGNEVIENRKDRLSQMR